MSQRKLIYAPELNSKTFLFFYEKGPSGRSYSIRDYSQPPKESVRYAKELPYNSLEILRLSQRQGCYCFDADVHDTTDFEYWHQVITSMNQRYLEATASSGAVQPVALPLEDSVIKPKFPIVNLDRLVRSQKACKREDMQRICSSPNSEDYVTWNMFNLLPQAVGDRWWRVLLELAATPNPAASQGLDSTVPPELEFWQVVPSPTRYEATSRDRMRRSGIAEWSLRAASPAPVEGASEIDLVLSDEQQLIFIEAKLGSDISSRTTYDPQRNQTIRNIDCLLERCGKRVPAFWMVARDIGPARSYVTVMQAYQAHPELAVCALPHQPPERVMDVIARMTILLWTDLLSIIEQGIGNDYNLRAVITELRRRIIV